MKVRLFILLPLAFFTLAALQAQDSLNMTALGQWQDPGLPSSGSIRYNDIWGYTDCEGREYAIFGNVRYTLFFELMEDGQPREVARFEGEVNSVWRDFKTYGHYAYGVADQGSEGLSIYDLSSLPDTVYKVAQTAAFFGRSHNIFIDEAHGRLYAAGSNTRSNGVVILDLAQDPAQPVLLGDPMLPAGGYIHDIHVRDHLAYCSHGFNGLSVYDLSDPTAPITLGVLPIYPEQGYNHSSWLTDDGQQLVFADETFGTSLKLLDVSDVQNMEVLSLFRSELLAPSFTNSIVHNPFVRAQYAVVSYYHDGVQIFDLSDPLDVQRAAYYDTYPQNVNYSGFNGCWGVYPFFNSGRMIASDMTNGLFVLSADSLSFPPLPAPQAELSLSGEQYICPGDSLLLSASFSGQGWQWFYNGQSLGAADTVLQAQAPGEYWLANPAAPCPLSSDTLRLIEVEAPIFSLPSLFPFCPGEPAQIDFSALPAEEYLLYKAGELLESSTEGQFAFSESGAYQIGLLQMGCETRSDSFEVQIFEAPAPPELQVPEPFCEGDSLALFLAVGNDDFSYTLPETGDTLAFGDTIYLSGGPFSISVANAFCETAFSFEITPSPLPLPGLAQEDEFLVSDYDSPLYLWEQNGEAVDTTTLPVFLPSSMGVYRVGVFSPEGCLGYSASVELVWIATAEARTGPSLRVFPVPVQAQLTVESSERIQQLQLFNAQGQVLRAYEPQAHWLSLPTDDWPAGVYWLRVRWANGQERAVKLVKWAP